ncbi:uncharacterized protein LOC122503692 isoform X2 [Leptopilina heterotoma]|uniref:uncharacterized protein LOC122503692 isoform X2 n=1 Tax=Leptopilina heterotoma TaxID=63436 RepID=UPI001CA9A14D|nr:uncharacterized protein LOC122503692 isoform X2 [Leptopilina heterotoma]
MAENCKAAGDSPCVENLIPKEELKEIGVKLQTVENGNSLLIKNDQKDVCPLIINEKKEEDLSKGDNKIIETKIVETSDTVKEQQEVVAKNGIEKVNTEDKPCNSPDVNQLLIEIEARTKERDNYHNKLIESEKKFDILETEYNALSNGKEDESSLRQEVKNLKIAMAQTQLKLDDRIRIVANQENQINALMSQVSSLKDVVNITKDLLNIRNMEVRHLQENVETMEEKINIEREKHNTMLVKMESAFKINLDLKQEYETQLRLFQDLREKYDKKVAILTEENVRLESLDKQNKTI